MRIESKQAGRKEREDWLAVLAAVLIGGIAFAGMNFFGVQLCLLNKFTGMPCPVCGSSRALILLLKGHPADAFVLQPLGSLAMPAAGLFILCNSYLVFVRKRALTLKTTYMERRFLFWLAVFLMGANWTYLLIRGVV